MADLVNTNRSLFIMKYQHGILVARAQIQAKEIRMVELLEDIERCKVDIEAQKKVITEAEKNIRLQQDELDKENPKQV